MNEHVRERVQAEALDRYLTELQEGGEAHPPEDAPVEASRLLAELADLSMETRAGEGFVRSLEANLRRVERRRSAKRSARSTWLPGLDALIGRGARPRRRVIVATAGAAVLVVFLLLLWAYVGREDARVEPPQVAQEPAMAWTEPASAQATRTPLPQSATIEPTPQPADSPTALAIGPTATQAPTAAPTSTVAEAESQLALAALARWGAGGVGGGGGPVAGEREYALAATLPTGPDEMDVYTYAQTPPLTAAYALEIAERLGVQGEVYASLGAAAAPRGGEEGLRMYLVVDGPREVLVEPGGIAHYIDRSRATVSDGYWLQPEGVPPLVDAIRRAESFLQPGGVLDAPYQVAASGNLLDFHQLIGGEWAVTEPIVRSYVGTDGEVSQVDYRLLAYDRVATYPVISAQAAWEILAADPADERVWENPYRIAEMPAWGEWRHENPPLWLRSYVAGDQAHRFGIPRTWFAVEIGGAPFVAMGNLVLSGDVQALADYVLQQYVAEQWAYVHVWGVIESTGEVQALRLEGWEPAEEAYWSGTVRRQDGLGLLDTDDGRTVALPDLPSALGEGMRISASGGQVGERLEWHAIQELRTAVSPPPSPGETTVLMTVERVDLVYLVLAPDVVSPEQRGMPSYRIVQPVWRFRGHGAQGSAFEVYVQAVSGEYVGD